METEDDAQKSSGPNWRATYIAELCQGPEAAIPEIHHDRTKYETLSMIVEEKTAEKRPLREDRTRGSKIFGAGLLFIGAVVSDSRFEDSVSIVDRQSP